MENEEEGRLAKIARLAVTKITELKIERDDLKQKLERKSMQYEDCISEMTAENKALKAEKEKLNSENEKLHLKNGELKQIIAEKYNSSSEGSVSEASYGNLEIEKRELDKILDEKVKNYIKGLVGKYEKLENALKSKEDEIKEKDGKIKSLDDKVSDLTEYNENLRKKYEELKGEEKESNDDSLRKLEKEVGDLGTLEGKIKEYEDKIKEYEEKTKEMAKYESKAKNWKKLAIILGISLALSLGYISCNHKSYNKTGVEMKK